MRRLSRPDRHLTGFPISTSVRTVGLRYLQTTSRLSERRRQNALMTPVAQTLTDDQIIALSNHYATLTQGTLDRRLEVQADHRMDSLVRTGDTARGIPGCQSCHGTGAGGPWRRRRSLVSSNSISLSNSRIMPQALAETMSFQDARHRLKADRRGSAPPVRLLCRAVKVEFVKREVPHQSGDALGEFYAVEAGFRRRRSLTGPGGCPSGEDHYSVYSDNRAFNRACRYESGAV